MRILALKYILTGLLIVLLGGLFYTQILQGEYYADLSENNRIRLLPVDAPRGRIMDRNHAILAGNRPSYNVYMILHDFGRELSPWLEGVLKLPPGFLDEQFTAKKINPYLPFELKQDVPREAIFKIEEKKPELTGVYITVAGRRYYPLNERTAHLTGYLGKVTDPEYREGQGKYGRNDFIGRAGVERIFDDMLRGEDGGRQVEVNSRGEIIRTLGEKKPVPGKDIILSIDADLQNIVWSAVEDHPNSLSVGIADVRTGEMLALVSKPSYDPNIFVSGGKTSDRLAALSDTKHPMLDRFISVGYPPGSVFKLVTASAGLETRKINPTTTFNCDGDFHIGSSSHTFHCWNAYGHGTMDLRSAITQSCNVFFYNVGRLVGENAIANTARIYGLGESPGLELPAVFPGLVPDDAWKRKELHDRWYQGETISFAIGQSYLLVSPLQVLRMVSTFANSGRIPTLTILKGKEPKLQPVAISSSTIESVRSAMHDVVQTDRGTGKYARVPFMEIGAKTGTAQNPTGKSHAWFGGFFPFEKPRFAMVTMIEQGGGGGLAAGTLSKEVLMAWKEKKGTQLV